MGAVQSSEQEFTTCCAARAVSQPEWTASLVTTPKEIREKHVQGFLEEIREWPSSALGDNVGDSGSRKARLRGLPEGMKQVLASKLPEDVQIYNSEAVKDIKQCSRKSECQCPNRSTERFFCEVCQRPTNSLGMWHYALPHSRARVFRV